jgi:hypothetical protein
VGEVAAERRVRGDFQPKTPLIRPSGTFSHKGRRKNLIYATTSSHKGRGDYAIYATTPLLGRKALRLISSLFGVHSLVRGFILEQISCIISTL